MKSFEPVIGGPNSCDLSAWTMGFPASNRLTGLPSSNNLTFSEKLQTVEIFGSATFPKEVWKAKGWIRWIVDLRGAQIFFIPPRSGMIPQRYAQFRDENRVALEHEGKIRTVVLRVADGREIWIGGSKLERTILRDGTPVFSIVLPKDESEWATLCSLDCN